MAKTAENIFVPTDLDGQVLQSTNETGLTADNIDIFEGSDGTFYREIGSKTKYTTKAKLRAMSNPNANISYETHDNGPQIWVLDATDTTSADNTGTVIVTADGKRMKAKFNGNVHALWYGMQTGNFDNAPALQAALNNAALLVTDVELLGPTTYYIKSPITIPAGVTLKMGTFTFIRLTVANKYAFRITATGKIKGGSIGLVNLTDVVGIYVCGHDAAPFSGTIPNFFLENVTIYGDRRSGQTAIGIYIGADTDLNPIASSSSDFVVNAIFKNVRILGVESGIDVQDLSTNGGTGWINSIYFDGGITAAKAITIGEIAGGCSGHRFEGYIQSEQASYISGLTEHWVVKAVTNKSYFNLGIFDWIADDNNFYGVDITGRGNYVVQVASISRYYIRVTGDTNRIIGDFPRASVPSYEIDQFLGDQYNMLLGADKKFTVTTDSTNNSRLSNVWYPQGNSAFAGISDAATNKYIDINFGRSVSYLKEIGICFEAATNAPDYIKIERYDADNNFTTLFEDAANQWSTVTWRLQYQDVWVANGIRITMQKASGTIYISRIYAFCQSENESFLPHAGGTIYGDLNLATVKGAGLISTDDNGKIVKGYSGSASLTGDGTSTQFTVPFAFGTAPTRIYITPTSEAAAMAQFYVSAITADGFTVTAAGAVPPNSYGINFNWLAN